MRPSGLRSTSSPFVRRREKRGSKPLGLDFENLPDSYNHRFNSELNLQAIQAMRIELNAAEAQGKYSKAKKLRRTINRLLEEGLALQSTWCGGCTNYLHRCTCPGFEETVG